MLALGSCSSGSGERLATAESGERGASDGASASVPPASADEIAQFCAKVGELDAMRGPPIDSSEDPEAAAEAEALFDDLVASAPEELRGHLEVLADLWDEFDSLEDSAGGSADPEEAMGDAFAMVFDPEVIAAGLAIEEFLVEQCGMDPSSTSGLGMDDPMGMPEEGFDDGGTTGGEDDPADISLEDLEAVEESNASASWVDKVVARSVLNEISVQLIASGGGEGGEPFTAEEGMAACEAVRAALGPSHPGLEIEVLNGDAMVASGTAESACAPA